MLLYGDSNTWGFDPTSSNKGRIPRAQRWTTLLQTELQVFSRCCGLCEDVDRLCVASPTVSLQGRAPRRHRGWAERPHHGV